MKYWQLFSGLYLIVAVSVLATETVWAFTVSVSTTSDAPKASERSFMLLTSTGRSLKVFATAASTAENTEFSNASKRSTPYNCITEQLDKKPRSVKVITRSQIKQQTVLTRDLNQILKRLVPGYQFSGRLHGSHPAVLIDGAPVLTNLKIIDPNAIQRIEVIVQGSAHYPY